MISSLAARLCLLQELLDPNVYDENGTIIGQKAPLITHAQARALLNFPAKEDAPTDFEGWHVNPPGQGIRKQ